MGYQLEVEPWRTDNHRLRILPPLALCYRNRIKKRGAHCKRSDYCWLLLICLALPRNLKLDRPIPHRSPSPNVRRTFGFCQEGQWSSNTISQTRWSLAKVLILSDRGFHWAYSPCDSERDAIPDGYIGVHGRDCFSNNRRNPHLVRYTFCRGCLAVLY